MYKKSFSIPGRGTARVAFSVLPLAFIRYAMISFVLIAIVACGESKTVNHNSGETKVFTTDLSASIVIPENQSIDDPFGCLSPESFFDAFSQKYSVEVGQIEHGDTASVKRANIGGVQVKITYYNSGKIFEISICDMLDSGNKEVFIDVLRMIIPEDYFQTAEDWIDQYLVDYNGHHEEVAVLGSTYFMINPTLYGKGLSTLVIYDSDMGPNMSSNYERLD